MSGPIPNAPRVPAHDLDAEQATLACCLLSAAAIAECRELVGPGDFYKPSHAHVFTAICTLDDRGEPADPVTVHTELVRLGTAEGVTVPDLLALDAPATTSAPHYAATVAELARKRRLAGAGMETTAAALDPTRSSSRVLEEAEGRLIHAHGESEPAGRYSTGEVADRVLARIEALAERGGGLSGLPTGFTDLDHLLGGVEPVILLVVGAL
ncbi:MAG: replicative DNA helicase, partial [Acidimicrobiales bacterium]